MTPRSSLLLILLAACGQSGLGDNPPYYPEDGTPPSVTALSPDAEDGNIGGQAVTIQGSGFGDDPNRVTVVFNGRNAEIVSVTDAEIVVVAPHGPIEGGPVAVTVGTPEGQATLSGGYTYEVDDLTSSETAYIVATNARFACYGGTENPQNPQCDGVNYYGDYGIEGSSEFYEIVYPRVHSTLVGFWGGVDTAPTWTVERPDVAQYAEWVDDLRVNVGDRFTLTNPALAGETACWPSDSEACDGEGEVSYDLSTMAYCTEPAVDGAVPRYVADWPIDRNFFAVPDNDGYDGETPVEIVLDVPEVGVNGVKLLLPEPALFRATEGFPVAGDEDQDTLWGTSGVQGCFDDDADGNTTLDEVALGWSWNQSSLSAEDILAAAEEANGPGVVEDVRVYVNASAIYGVISWLSLESYAVRASIEVPDEEGLLEMPVSVMYQFPSLTSSWGEVSIGRFIWGDPLQSDYALLLFSLNRVVEYRINTDQGDLVFAYVNADIGFSSWSNPLDQDDCGDCLDNDGDGWADDEDPDCARDGTAELGFGDTTCNDGEDNDGNGLVDHADPVCEEATDEESNCFDGIDNDLDFETDEDDCECKSGGNETTRDDGDLPCCNGDDDDGDGWIDDADPSCQDGSEEGLSGEPCNDGIDNDGNGDIDANDPYCGEEGAFAESEQPEFEGDCIDGLDNDEDGYTDANDPGCEYGYNSRETSNPDESSVVPTCYDGIDNDEDELTDAQDEDCALDGTPNGYQAEGE